MNLDLTSVVGLFSAVAAAFAAGIAYQANRRMAKADRDHRVREVSLLVNKVKLMRRLPMLTILVISSSWPTRPCLHSQDAQAAASLANTRTKSRRSKRLSSPCSKRRDICSKTVWRSYATRRSPNVFWKFSFSYS